MSAAYELRQEIYARKDHLSRARSAREKVQLIREIRFTLTERPDVPKSARSALLFEVFPTVVALQRDDASVRKEIPAFIESACRVSVEDFFPEGLNALTKLLEDENQTVQQSVARTLLALFGIIVNYFATFSEAKGSAWSPWKHLTVAMANRMWSTSEPLQRVAIKHTEVTILAFSSGRDVNDNVFLRGGADRRIPQIDRQSLEDHADWLFGAMCEPLERPQRAATANAPALIVFMNCLGEICRLRPLLLNRAAGVLKTVAYYPNKMLSPNFAVIEKASVQTTVKTNLMSILKTSYGRQPGTLEMIIGALERLGGGQAADSLLRSINRAKRPHPSSEAVDGGESGRKRPHLQEGASAQTEAKTMKSFAEVQPLVEELKRLPLPQLVEFVVQNMNNLPAVVPTDPVPVEKPKPSLRDPRRDRRRDPRRERAEQARGDPRARRQGRGEAPSGMQQAGALEGQPSTGADAPVLGGEPAAPIQAQLPPELAAALQSGQFVSPAALQSALFPALVAAQQYGSMPGANVLQVPTGAPPGVAAGAPLQAPPQAPTAEQPQALGGAAPGPVYPPPQVQTADPGQPAAAAGGLNQEQHVDSTQLPLRPEPETTTEGATASIANGGTPVSGTPAAATPSTAASAVPPAAPTHSRVPPPEPAVTRHVRVKRTEPPPIEARALTALQAIRLRTLIAQRIMHREYEAEESGAVQLRIQLLCRMLVSSKQDTPGDDFEPEDQGDIRDKCIGFISENLTERMELAQQWLYAEAASMMLGEETGKTADEEALKGGTEDYEKLLLTFMGLAQGRQDADKLLSRLLIEAPLIPSDILEELKRLSEDPSTCLTGLALLGDVVIERSGEDRTSALDILLHYAVCGDELLRGPSIRLVTNKLLELQELRGEIEKFAVSAVEEATAGKERKDVDEMKDGEETTEGEEHNEGKEGKEGKESKQGGDASADWGEGVGLRQSLHLFLSLCAKKPGLLVKLAELSVHSSTEDRDIIFEKVDDVARKIGAESETLLGLIRGDLVPEASAFELKLLETLASDPKQAVHLLDSAKTRFARDKNVAFALPVLSYLDKPTLIRMLPAFVEEGDDKIMETVIDRTTSGSRPAMMPSELMYELHVVNADRSKVEQALQLCFARKDVFKQEEVATVLQRMVEMTPLPDLFMSSVIQTAKCQPKLQSFISQSILGRLVERASFDQISIWSNEATWNKFIEAFEVTMPRSGPVLLRLPPTRLQEAVSQSERLRENLTRYARESRTPLPGWLVSIIDSRAG